MLQRIRSLAIEGRILPSSRSFQTDAGAGRKTLVLPHASVEELCHLILAEEVRTVVCGAIEEEYCQYLTWKKITVIDSVMGPWEKALERYTEGCLQPGDILHQRPEHNHHGRFSQ